MALGPAGIPQTPDMATRLANLVLLGRPSCRRYQHHGEHHLCPCIGRFPELSGARMANRPGHVCFPGCDWWGQHVRLLADSLSRSARRILACKQTDRQTVLQAAWRLRVLALAARICGSS